VRSVQEENPESGGDSWEAFREHASVKKKSGKRGSQLPGDCLVFKSSMDVGSNGKKGSETKGKRGKNGVWPDGG